MASTNRTPCHFFARGLCKKGDSCIFAHEQSTSIQGHREVFAQTLTAFVNPGLNPSVTSDGDASTPPVCVFFRRGLCSRGDSCRFNHSSSTTPVQEPNSDVIYSETPAGRQSDIPQQATPDSRSNILCRFFSSSKGCRNSSCPYLHAERDHNGEHAGDQDLEETANEGQDQEHDFTRDLSGASVSYNDTGHILKVALPTDFSLACITGIRPDTTPEAIVEILREFNYHINVDCVRIPGFSAPSEAKALVKVEDPSFAKELSIKLKSQSSSLSALSLPIDARRSNCRKLHVSWHKKTRTIWLNYGNGGMADKVARHFRDGQCKVLGQSVKCSLAQRSANGTMRHSIHYNPVAWTVTLSDVPSNATMTDIKAAVGMTGCQPRHIEVGATSYRASDSEVSVKVRSLLEEHGRLESFYLAPASIGKRVKAAALFQEEADARSASSLNNTRLSILEQGKLTVTLLQSTKVKVQTRIYIASKRRIDGETQGWRERHLVFHVYLNSLPGFTTLKIDGDNANEVARARRALDEISRGTVLRVGETAIWASALNANGSAYRGLKATEAELQVVINRDRSKRQLLFFGPPEKLQQAIAKITQVLKEDSSTTYEIDLNAQQFSWMIQGGFKHIENAIGKNVAVLDVVSKKVVVSRSGTHQQYELVTAIMNGKHEIDDSAVTTRPSLPEGDCPICFCEADNPFQTSCKHTYCLECFEDYCKSAASGSKDQFEVKCQGDEGSCATVFTLQQLKEWVSSSVFERVLESSFEEYIQRHPEAFHYCPTPDCGYIYRPTPNTDTKPAPYSCGNCFEAICTSCHARHGEYTCVEYKDIATGGYQALKKLKEELNIKDCPKCTTSMEKTEGCNHMTCQGCKAHICWVCMAVFDTPGPCYEHMNVKHGGNGLGRRDLMDWY